MDSDGRYRSWSVISLFHFYGSCISHDCSESKSDAQMCAGLPAFILTYSTVLYIHTVLPVEDDWLKGERRNLIDHLLPNDP